MQLCLGATYSWSVYVQPLRESSGLMQGTAQLPFTLFYFAFPATMMFAGQFLPKMGPRRCAMLGGILFGGGWMLAGLGRLDFLYTVMGIGLLAGIGAGFAYIVPIATCIRWFPEHQGLVTGVAVAGFGGGAAVISQIGGLLMNHLTVSPFATFSVFGVAFVFLVTSAGFFMVNPDQGASGSRRRLAVKRVIGERAFWLLYAAMFTALSAGFTVNANLKDLYAGGPSESGIAAVALFALANAGGRIGWGMLFDRWSPIKMIQANLLAQAGLLLTSPLILRSGTGLLLFAALTGFNYGGVLVIYASSAARLWGKTNVGQVYSLLFSSNIPAALAPLMAGYIFDYTDTFFPALAGAALLMTMTAIAGARFGPLSATRSNPS